MSDSQDPNLAGGLVGSEDEGWAENDFNLLDYIGKDDSPADYDDYHNSYNPDEEEMREKDRYYSALQYNNVMLNGDDQYDNYPNTPLYAPQHMNHNYYHDSPFNQDSTLMPSTSRNSSMVHTPTQVKMEPISTELYEEPGYYPSNRAESESSYQSSTSRAKPRKYRIKSENEKRNPQYRAKREKNNDAVRRSRDKAKREQERRDFRLRELEAESAQKSSKIKELEQKVRTLHSTLLTLKNNCTCHGNMR